MTPLNDTICDADSSQKAAPSRIVGVRLGRQDYSKLVRISDSLGLTRSDVVRLLLREFEQIQLVVSRT